MVTKKPSSVILEEGENVTLVCQASGLPIPTIKWQKPLGHLPRGRTAVIDGNMTIISVTNLKGYWDLRMLSKESPWRRLRFGRDNSDRQAQIYRDTSFKGCRICVQQPDAKLQSPGSSRNNLEEDQQISSSKPRFNFKRKLVSQTGDCK